MLNCSFLIFVTLGFIEGLLLFRFKSQIFDYNPELGFNTLGIKVNKKGDIKHSLEDKRKAYASSPIEQKIWSFFSVVFGVILGWILLWYLLDKRLKYFSHEDIKWEDIVLFLLAYIGISGRLHTIAESVQAWFKR